MADVSAQISWRRVANLSVHVGAIHVDLAITTDLAAVVVDDVNHLLDFGFKDSVGRGVSDHRVAEVLLVLLRLLF